MKRYLLDTNAVLRYIINDVPDQSRVMIDVFRQVKAGACAVSIPLVVFFEATYALTGFYGYSRSVVKEYCEKFLAIPYLEIPEREILRLGYRTWVDRVGISFADAVLLHMAHTRGEELLTFDKKLATLTRKISKI